MALKYWYSATNQNFATTNWYTSPPTIAGPVGIPTTITTVDDAVFTQYSGTAIVTISSNINIKSITTTGFTGTIAGTSTITINSTDASNNSLLLGSGTIWTHTGPISFTSTSGVGNINFNSLIAGGNITFNGAGGSWQLTGDLSTVSTATITLQNGTFNANGYNVTTNIFNSNFSTTRTLSMGSGTWTLTGTGTVWNISTTTTSNLTFNSQQSRILMNNTSSPATGLTFAGAGLTYYTVEHARASSTGALLIAGSNTFTNFIDNTSTAAHTINITSGTTQTFYKFIVKGSSGALITLSRSSTTAVSLVKVGQGVVSNCDYLTVSANVPVTPSSGVWYAGANSTGSGGNWTMTNALSSQSLLGIGGIS